MVNLKFLVTFSTNLFPSLHLLIFHFFYFYLFIYFLFVFVIDSCSALTRGMGHVTKNSVFIHGCNVAVFIDAQNVTRRHFKKVLKKKYTNTYI